MFYVQASRRIHRCLVVRPTPELTAETDHLAGRRTRLQASVLRYAAQLLPEAVVDRREVCEIGGSRSVTLNHVARRVERVVIGGRDKGNTPLCKTRRAVSNEFVAVPAEHKLECRGCI